MATRTTTTLVDDVDGGPADQTIDLGDRLRFLLAEALAEARRLDAADSGRCGPHADDPNEELDRIEREAGPL